MTSIKSSLDSLCKLFRHFSFTTPLSPETFLLSKQNDPKMEPILWHLLFECLYYIRYGVIDDVCRRTLLVLPSQEIRVYVAHNLLVKGCMLPAIRDLLNETSISLGSRDLLIAFGWLFSKEGFSRRWLVHSWTAMATSETDMTFHFISIDKKPSPPKAAGDSGNFGSLNQLLWLDGRIRKNLKRLYWIRRGNAKALHQIYSYTTGVTLDRAKSAHLSLSQLLLLKHPDRLRSHLKTLSEENARLQDLLDWQDHHEGHFWAWMDSVLDVHLQGVEIAQLPSGPEQEQRYTSAIHMLSDIHRRLHDTLVKHETVAQKLQRAWIERSSVMSSDQIHALVTQVDAEIAVIERDLESARRGVTISLASRWHDHSASSTQQQKTGKQERSFAGKELQARFNAGISRVESILQSLEENLKHNEKEFTHVLRTVSEQLSESISLHESGTQLLC